MRDDELAFPITTATANYATGMTLRDYFAAKAMNGLVAGAQHDEQINLHGAAEWSYNMADAMLQAREA